MTQAAPILETPRLILRPLELADAPAVQRIFPQWEVVQYLNSLVPWPYPADGAESFIRELELPAMEAGTEWHWSIRPRQEPQRLIGCISLSDGEDNNRGFWLDPAWQGQGLMTEASDKVTDFWFETLGRSTLRIPKAIANPASRRISEKSGMRVIATGEADFVSGRLPQETWEITREEWRTRRNQTAGG
jgi:ribosomal-protein-alanine N-acetyltransferase